MNLNMLKKKRKADEAFDSEYEYVYNRWENDSSEGVFRFCNTNSFHNFLATEDIYCTSKTEYRISLTEDALKDQTDLRKNVKRILELGFVKG